MAGKMCNLYLEEDTVQGLDELAEKLGLSRSKVANMTLKAALGGMSIVDFTAWAFASADKRHESEPSSEKGEAVPI